MAIVPYRYSTFFGNNTYMIPCLSTFLAEVAQAVELGLLSVTNLGQVGDARHQAEPTSRHNPALGPDGRWYICAADFGGRDYLKLGDFFQYMYKRHDPRLYTFGFSNRGDGTGITWTSGAWHWTGNDKGHCHFDSNMKYASLGRDWWVPALMSTAPWGLIDWLRTGGVSDNTDNESVEDDMALVPQNEWTDVKNGVSSLLSAIGAGFPVTLYKVASDPAVYAGQLGRFWHVPEHYPELLAGRKLTGPIVQLDTFGELDFVRRLWTGDDLPAHPSDKAGTFKMSVPTQAVDTGQLAVAIASAIKAAGTTALSDADIAKVAATTVTLMGTKLSR